MSKATIGFSANSNNQNWVLNNLYSTKENGLFM